MSYGITPYRVHLSDIELNYGNNLDAKESLLNATVNFLNDLDESFPVQNGWKKSFDLLESFLSGNWNITDENITKHWYVIEILIKGYGKSLSNEYWYPANIDEFYNYSEFQMFLISLENTFHLPSADGFPTVFTIQNKNLVNTLKIIENDIKNVEQKKEFISWINETIENDQDLVLFYY